MESTKSRIAPCVGCGCVDFVVAMVLDPTGSMAMVRRVRVPATAVATVDRIAFVAHSTSPIHRSDAVQNDGCRSVEYGVENGITTVVATIPQTHRHMARRRVGRTGTSLAQRDTQIVHIAGSTTFAKCVCCVVEQGHGTIGTLECLDCARTIQLVGHSMIHGRVARPECIPVDDKTVGNAERHAFRSPQMRIQRIPFHMEIFRNRRASCVFLQPKHFRKKYAIAV